MSWDRSARPKRMRRKHQRMVIIVALVASLILVSVIGFWQNTKFEGGFAALIDWASSVLSEDEQRVVWEGMSDEGRAVILRHRPAQDTGSNP